MLKTTDTFVTSYSNEYGPVTTLFAERLQGGTWYVASMDHPGAWATGETKKGAISAIDTIIEGWKEVRKRLGGPT